MNVQWVCWFRRASNYIIVIVVVFLQRRNSDGGARSTWSTSVFNTRQQRHSNGERAKPRPSSLVHQQVGTRVATGTSATTCSGRYMFSRLRSLADTCVSRQVAAGARVSRRYLRTGTDGTRISHLPRRSGVPGAVAVRNTRRCRHHVPVAGAILM